MKLCSVVHQNCTAGSKLDSVNCICETPVE